MTLKTVTKQEQKAEKKQKKADLLKTEGTVLSAEEREAVDQLLALEKQLEETKPLLKQYEETKKYVASIAADQQRFDPAKPAKLVGNTGVAEFSEETRSREIKDMHNLIGKLKEAIGGYENLIEQIKIPLTVVDKYLTESEQEGLVGKADKGSRRFKGVHEKGE